MPHELEGEHRPLAQPVAGGEAAQPVGGYPAECGAEHGLRGRTGAAGDDSHDTRPDRATRYVETTQGFLSYTELAPLLAERVAKVEAMLTAGEFELRSLDDSLLMELHRRICGDLVPEWAGRWREIEVRVGNLQPPLPLKCQC